MLAVERFDQCLTDRLGLRVAGHHRHPGHGLKNGPVRAQDEDERNEGQPFEQPR